MWYYNYRKKRKEMSNMTPMVLLEVLMACTLLGIALIVEKLWGDKIDD